MFPWLYFCLTEEIKISCPPHRSYNLFPHASLPQSLHRQDRFGTHSRVSILSDEQCSL